MWHKDNFPYWLAGFDRGLGGFCAMAPNKQQSQKVAITKVPANRGKIESRPIGCQGGRSTYVDEIVCIPILKVKQHSCRVEVRQVCHVL
jgi:hypothetical protein